MGAPGWPCGSHWKAKTSKNQWKNKVFRTIATKTVFRSRHENILKLDCHDGKIAITFCCLTPGIKPKQFKKQPKLHSRAGESSVWNILKETN